MNAAFDIQALFIPIILRLTYSANERSLVGIVVITMNEIQRKNVLIDCSVGVLIQEASKLISTGFMSV